MTRKKQTKTKNVERHAGGLSKLKHTYSSTPFYLNDTNTPNIQLGFNFLVDLYIKWVLN